MAISRRWLVGLAVVILAASMPFLAGGAAAQQERAATSGAAGIAVPSPPSDVGAAKAYAVLERNCSHCHQAGRLTVPAAGGNIANLLALDEVANDPALVRPGVPDASRIYTVALTKELHLDLLNDPVSPEPTASELQALRDWIADRTPRTLGQCARRPRLSAEQIAQRMAAALAALAPETARQTRFASLAANYNDCATWAELDGLRQGLRRLLADAIPGDRPPRDAAWPPAIDPEQLLITVPLDALGWTVEDWDRQAARYPLGAALKLPRRVVDAAGTTMPLMPADWLAEVMVARGSASADRLAGPAVWGLPAVEALRHSWRRPADFNRVAAELWLEPGDLARRLSRAPYDIILSARQLRSGGTARRAQLLPLMAALAGNTPLAPALAPAPAIDAEAAPLEVALWMEADSYKAGDAAVFNIATNRDCHLTLINVDRTGRAIVLYPNELEPDNLIRAGRTFKVPSFDAPYRFRFKDKGRETAIAICSTSQKAPAGIAHDYDRLRFTSLGDWQLFLREPPDVREARRDDAATDTPRPSAPQRRRGRAAQPKAAPPPPPADVQTRTAITIDIE